MADVGTQEALAPKERDLAVVVDHQAFRVSLYGLVSPHAVHLLVYLLVRGRVHNVLFLLGVLCFVYFLTLFVRYFFMKFFFL